jgi:hypothetical protein
MEQLNQTSEIVGYKTRYFEHTKVDDLHLPENNANKLPECLDGLWIQDLKLTFREPTCIQGASPCSQTPCSTGATLDYIQGITSITFTHVNSKNLTIVPTTSGTGSVIITIPSGGGTLSGANLNVTAVSDGDYVGTITFGSASHQFYYSVKNGHFEHYPKGFMLTHTGNYNCYNYVQNGGYRMNYQYESEYHNINSTAFQFELDTQVVSSNFISPAKAITQTGVGLIKDLVQHQFEYTLTLANGVTLTNKLFLKIKCQ